jgi:secreted trypsin-like serine protease
MLRTPAALLCLFASVATATAMVGGAGPAGDAGRSVVLLVGSRGTSCTGVALAPQLILTAGHCVLPGADYKLVAFDAAHRASLKDIATIARHPEFDVNAVLRHRVTADVALLKPAGPLPNPSAVLAPAGGMVAPGDRFVVIGYGLAKPGDGKSGGTVRTATLTATGKPGTLQIRLVDPATKGERAGLGACTGDSGAPVFRDVGGRMMVAGVVSWSTGPRNAAGCGGLTGVTPLTRYRAWIVQQAKTMGAVLGP